MANAVPDLLAQDLASNEFLAGVEREFWRLVERVGDRVYVDCFAWDGDTYVLELTCNQYAVEPCLGRFVDPQTRRCVASAWPSGDGTFGTWFKWQPQHLFICWPGDRAGIQHHSDWRARAHWTKTGNPLVQYLEFIRQCLTIRARGYQPRPKLPLAS